MPARTKPLDSIVIKGARELNLKNINVTIPRDNSRPDWARALTVS